MHARRGYAGEVHLLEARAQMCPAHDGRHILIIKQVGLRRSIVFLQFVLLQEGVKGEAAP